MTSLAPLALIDEGVPQRRAKSRYIPTGPKKAHFERGVTGVKLWPDDALRLRALRSQGLIRMGDFVRAAVKEKLARDFPSTSSTNMEPAQ